MGNVKEKKVSTGFILVVIVLALIAVLITGLLFYRNSSSNKSFVKGLTDDAIYTPGTAPARTESATDSTKVNNDGKPVDEVFTEDLWKEVK